MEKQKNLKFGSTLALPSLTRLITRRTLFAALTLALVSLLSAQARAAAVGYVTNFSDSTVSVIATASNTVVATIPVGANPYGVAVTPDGGPCLRGKFQQ